LNAPSQSSSSNSQQRSQAFLVGLILPGQPGPVVEEHLDELAQLADTAGVRVVGRAMQARKAPDAATFIGKGKVEEVAAEARRLGADLLVFDDDLSAGQAKNLEEATELSVLDRSGLILEIFDQRAQSREARTQVELARLNYQLPRLTKRWSHLSRQAGGIGMRGGEGEKQLEQDRRVLRQRIRHLNGELEKIERTRGVQRHGRRGTPTVALTGYTNAGKSTLFNRLTAAGTLAENRLFATLDAKLRRGVTDGGSMAVFADTVGFIRKLPHHLVSSFRSTLGEITAADLVLHVVDRSHPRWQEQMEVAAAVLDELGVERSRIVTVYNKSDLVAAAEPRNGHELWVSATTGQGIDGLRREVAHRLARPGAAAAAAPAAGRPAEAAEAALLFPGS
jgi:GTP-binding protein HflX